MRGGVNLCKGVEGAERTRVLEESRWGSTFFGILMRRMGGWVLGRGRCVGCNCDLWSQARALDPLALGVSQHSFLLADTTRLLGQSIP
jgi:hypothetical protein